MRKGSSAGYTAIVVDLPSCGVDQEICGVRGFVGYRQPLLRPPTILSEMISDGSI